MSASVTDREALMALKPQEVAAYLRATQWRLEDMPPSTEEPVAAYWAKARGEEVLLPLAQDLLDYALRMSQLLATVARVEGRSESTVMRDLQAAASDLIRIRVIRKDSGSDRIPLEFGVRLVESAKSLLLAAASATVDAKPYYASRPSQLASEFIRNAALGQTERGSYVLTLLATVPPFQHTIDDVDKIPFERQVTNVLATAVAALRRATETAAETGDLEPFLASVPQGVSANLCDAISQLIEDGQADVDLKFAWAYTRPQTRSDIPNHVHFASGMARCINDAAKFLREVEPWTGFEFTGMVVQLRRPEESDERTAVIACPVDGNLKHVTLDRIDDASYTTLIRAFENKELLRGVGTLARKGRRYMISEPREIRAVDID